MAVNLTWGVAAMECFSHLGTYQDVVFKVSWTLTAVNDETGTTATTQGLESVAIDPSKGPADIVTPGHIDYTAYRKSGGYELARACLSGERTRDSVVSAMEDSGLRGLGGAGFPTGRKWRLVAAEPDIDLTVFFGTDFSARAFTAGEFGREIKWDVPLLDGVACAISMAEGLAGQAPRKATRGSLSRPAPVDSVGLSPALRAALRDPPALPFAARDLAECWLLDAAGEPLALLASAPNKFLKDVAMSAALDVPVRPAGGPD